MRHLILLASIIITSCSISKINNLHNTSGVLNIKNKMPVSIVYIKPEPIDSLKNSLQKGFKEKGISIVTVEEIKRLIKSSSGQYTNLFNPNDTKEKMMEKIINKTEPVANMLSIKFFQKNSIIDSIQWSIYYTPKLKIFIPLKHCFIPQNKTPTNAINEFTDSLITSPDFK
ncbi:MAG: hypothetical protein H7178_09600 [Chitinophagaceae bacterium]|nr:hypothetical protein [Chitinophagaceae bacterium]